VTGLGQCFRGYGGEVARVDEGGFGGADGQVHASIGLRRGTFDEVLHESAGTKDGPGKTGFFERVINGGVPLANGSVANAMGDGELHHMFDARLLGGKEQG
jgi:hypothetical protein